MSSPKDFVITPSEHCPEACPPADAGLAIGKIIRFVKSTPPNHDDMKTWAEMGRQPGQGDACQRCGLSVLVDESDVAKARAVVPFFRKLKVAVAEFRSGQAKLRQTGSNEWHHSLWLDRTLAATVHQLFKVIHL